MEETFEMETEKARVQVMINGDFKPLQYDRHSSFGVYGKAIGFMLHSNDTWQAALQLAGALVMIRPADHNRSVLPRCNLGGAMTRSV